MNTKTRKESYKDLYQGITTTIGLIIDVLALITIINSQPIKSMTGPENDTLLLFGNTWVELKNIALFGLVVVAIIFALVALYSSSDATEFAYSFLRFAYLLIFPIVFWAIVYYPFGTIQLYRHIIEIWFVGLISLLLFPHIRTVEIGCLSIGLLSALLLAGIGILEQSLEQLSWVEAVKTSLMITLLGFIAPWGLFLVVSLLPKGIYWLIVFITFLGITTLSFLIDLPGLIMKILQDPDKSLLEKSLNLIFGLLVLVDIVIVILLVTRSATGDL
jgi:hypothetical protein